jgi:hypothetical protein
MFLQIASLVGWTIFCYVCVAGGICVSVVGLRAHSRRKSFNNLKGLHRFRAAPVGCAPAKEREAIDITTEGVAIFVQPWLLDARWSDEDT